jgi:hypothetical protein
MSIDELTPLTLTQVARGAGVDPFTAVRILVASSTMPTDVLQFGGDAVELLRELGRIEEPWWDDLEAAYDLPAQVQVLLAILLERGWVGERATPLHNALRGLDEDRTLALRDAVEVMAEQELLVLTGSEIGLLIAVNEEQVPLVRRVASGETQHDALTQLFEEYVGA